MGFGLEGSVGASNSAQLRVRFRLCRFIPPHARETRFAAKPLKRKPTKLHLMSFITAAKPPKLHWLCCNCGLLLSNSKLAALQVYLSRCTACTVRINSSKGRDSKAASTLHFAVTSVSTKTEGCVYQCVQKRCQMCFAT